MTEDRKIVMLKSMMDGDYTSDDILSVYLELAGQKILNQMYPYKEDYTGIEVPDKYVMIQIQIACYLLNKRGAEGEIQHIENGIHRNYGSSDIPDVMLKDILPFCSVLA